ncbi:hypothetical protein Ate01nite_15610 [Actinoplanes teichomyceticus]|nr:hypothetical protein Ate01nite_15610 [Actinoplanes teichomyceticus]
MDQCAAAANPRKCEACEPYAFGTAGMARPRRASGFQPVGEFTRCGYRWLVLTFRADPRWNRAGMSARVSRPT